MVYYLAGNSVLSKEIHVRNHVAQFGGAYRKIFADEEGKLEELRNAASSVGLFADRRILDIVDFDDWPKREKDIFSKMEFPIEGVDVFVRVATPPKLSSGDPWVKVLNFQTPKEWEEEKWIEFIVKLAESIGSTVSVELARLLFTYVGADEFGLFNELRKLMTYSGGDLDKLSPSDAEGVLFKRTVTRLDAFCFTISEVDERNFNSLVAEVSREYEPPLIVHVLGRHFIDLLHLLLNAPKRAKYSWPDVVEISKKLSSPTPRVARFLGFKFKGQEHTAFNHVLSYETSDVARLVVALYDLDRKVKSGGELRILLYNFFHKVKTLVRRNGEVRI